jgi:UDP-N-acetyl-2-amino-2-deoxyglucuronate dehydrogenase
MTIHIGLIGGGNISQTHARAARTIDGVQIAAVFGSNAEKVRHLGAEHGAAWHTDYERFLAHRPMDLVAIGSPSGLHAEYGIAAARCGLHVLVEKPIDISSARADALIAETEIAGVKLGVFFQDRFKPGIRQMKSAIDGGALGKPVLADARVKWYRPPEYYGDSRWRGTLALDGGGALINQGIHTIDLLLWMFGEVVAVQAREATAVHKIEAEDTLVAVLEFSNGALGSFIATTSAYPGYRRRIELSGANGTLILAGDELVSCGLRHSMKERVKPTVDDLDHRASSPVVKDFRYHQAVFEDFIHAIQSNSQAACDGREARRSLALVEAIYTACRTGQRLVLSSGPVRSS